MEKINYRLLKYFYVFTVLIIYFVNLRDGNLTIYSSLIIGIILIMFNVQNIIKNKIKLIIYLDKYDKYIFRLIFIYLFISAINAFIKNKSGMGFWFTSSFPLIMFIFLVIYLNNLYEGKISDFVIKLFIIASILSIIIYILGYSKVGISFKHLLILTPNSKYVELFNEKRLSWMCSHKSRFATFCVIGIWFIVRDKKMNIKNKIFCTFILFVNIYLSNTKTALLITLITIIINSVLWKKIFIKKIIRKNKYIFIIFTTIIFLVLGVTVCNVIKTRDVSNLGKRTYIWESSFKLIKDNFLGIVKFDSNNVILHPKAPDVTFQNAHNLFLNQIIEKGIIPGVIFIIIFILIFFKFKEYKKNIDITWFFCIIALNMMDYTIAAEINYIFWSCLAIIYCDMKETHTISKV